MADATRGSDIYDRETSRMRVCAQECSSCIFKPDSPFRTGPGKLRDGRFRELVKTAKDTEGFITCHKTLDDEEPQEAICRGFYDRFSTNTMRVGQRLGGGRITEVDVG